METKICVRCKNEKNVEEFHTKGKENRRNSWCKSCVYESQKNRWKDRKRKAVSLFGGKCQCCGYDKNLAALEFHHVNASEKEFDFSKLRLKKWESIIEELKKCILVCSNCHKEIHYPLDEKNDVLNDNNLLNHVLSYKSLEPTGKCPTCESDVYGTKYCCVDCVSKARRKVPDRPSKSKLMEMLKVKSFCAIGREYNVSDNAVRKWAKKYELI